MFNVENYAYTHELIRAVSLFNQWFTSVSLISTMVYNIEKASEHNVIINSLYTTCFKPSIMKYYIIRITKTTAYLN